MLIIADAPACFSSNAVRAVRNTFCDSNSTMFSHALRFFGIKDVEKQILNQNSSAIFLDNNHDFIHTSDSNARSQYPDAFLLFDGLSTAHLRRKDGAGVLHVAHMMNTVMWEESKRGCIRESFIQCAKRYLSL